MKNWGYATIFSCYSYQRFSVYSSEIHINTCKLKEAEKQWRKSQLDVVLLPHCPLLSDETSAKTTISKTKREASASEPRQLHNFFSFPLVNPLSAHSLCSLIAGYFVAFLDEKMCIAFHFLFPQHNFSIFFYWRDTADDLVQQCNHLPDG